ncbi:hypothetical protein B0H11DRAFT_2032269 [Mycena galericulata]|nr:hypothetical protein B0H11DRAFT_2032269 [Mycena galericulata]
MEAPPCPCNLSLHDSTSDDGACCGPTSFPPSLSRSCTPYISLRTSTLHLRCGVRLLMCGSRCIGFAGVAAFDPCAINDSELSVVFLPSTIPSIKRVTTSFHRIAFIFRSTTPAFRSFAVEWSQENESLYDVHLPLVRVSTSWYLDISLAQRRLIRQVALRCSALPRPSPRSLSSFSPYYPRYLDFTLSPAYFSAPTRHMRSCDGADST